MAVKTLSLSFSSRGNAEVIEITGNVQACVLESGLVSGIVTVFSPSATSALTTIEYEPGAVRDLQRLFDQIVSPDLSYAHNERWGDGNGHSHVRAALLGPALTVPFLEKTLTLGTWQQIIFIDFDVRPRQRELVVQVMGE